MTIRIVCAAALLACLAAAGAEDGFESMFNGKDLDGWDGKPGGWWVEDGVITSQSTEENPCKKHHYLFWEGGKPADFVLRFKYKLVGGNSGVQFRSERRPEYDVWGYQADMEDGDQWSGCLFQHERGGVVMRGFKAKIAKDGTREEEQFADPAKLLEVVRKHEWNEYEVRAEGPHISLRINGKLMCEVEDHQDKYALKDGVIALQMHPGPPMKVQFKDLRIKVMKKEAE